MATIYAGDFGTVIRCTLNADITGYTLIKLIIVKPDLTEVDRTVTVEDPLNGVITITTQSGDIDVVGTYCLRPEVTFAASFFYGETYKLKVTGPCD